MKVNYWFYEIEPTMPELKLVGESMYGIKALSLKTIKDHTTATVVYPAPWELERPDTTSAEDEWIDFYRQILGLKQEFPDRIELCPADCFLARHKQKKQKPDPHSQTAIMLRLRRPELIDIFCQLESRARIVSRKAFLQEEIGHLSPVHLALIHSALLGQSKGNTDTKIPKGEAGRVEIATTEAPKSQSHKNSSNGLAKLTKELILKNSEIEQLNADLDKVTQENRLLKANLEIELEENNLLLSQLFQLQEELERYFIDNTALREEVSMTLEIVKEAYAVLAPQKTEPT